MIQKKSATEPELTIQRAVHEDAPEIARVFRLSITTALPFLPTMHTPEEDLHYFADEVLRKNDVFVARIANGQIIGFIAFNEAWVNHLYLLPNFLRQGVGQKLLNLAKSQRRSLMLWAFQKNETAKQFYTKQGFQVINETDGRDNEEKEPDILFEWSNQN